MRACMIRSGIASTANTSTALSSEMPEPKSLDTFVLSRSFRSRKSGMVNGFGRREHAGPETRDGSLVFSSSELFVGLVDLGSSFSTVESGEWGCDVFVKHASDDG
ncbi:uncharacterized protein MYCGRDRAFT_105920, partial [Zymoseptoria tritici IPO323]